MKRLSIAIIFSFCALSFISCHNKKDKKKETAKASLEVSKPTVPQTAYGFNLSQYELVRDTVKSGDTFGKIMGKHGVSIGETFQITHQINDSLFDTKKIILGKPYIIVKDRADSSGIRAFVYIKDKINYSVINLSDSIWVENKKKPVTTKQKVIAGIINSSLSEAMMKKGAGISLIQELENIFQWKIDFFRIQKGDIFKVIYNINYVDDTVYAGIKNIDAAEFIHYGDPYYAFRFGEDAENGAPNFYSDSAKTLESFFLKSPIKFATITSPYQKRRFHPVLHRWMSHLGTDYAAPAGTPIHVTADGVVIASRYTKYNGNYVKVRHNSKYTTQYLHMSKRLVSRGEHVAQGEVIGLVGQTGLATGPHVCYRFWVNGRQVDPYQQDLPSGEPLPDSLKAEFYQHINPLKQKLQNISVEKPKKQENLASVIFEEDLISTP